MNDVWNKLLVDAGAVIQGEGVEHFGDPARERTAAARGSIVADLSHLALIRVQGEDAATFLQGQLTNDIRRVDERHSQLSAYCNPKGRMLALFRVLRREDGWYLQLPASLAEAITRRLRMYVLRARTTLAPADDQLVRIGLSGAAAAQALADLIAPLPEVANECRTHDGLTVLRLHGAVPRFQVLGPAEGVAALWPALASRATPAGAPAWRWLDIRAGVPVVYPETQEAFVPQMANLDLLDGIGFNKGCYTGQEIVARVHYLGRLKQRMYLAWAAGPALPGQAIYAPDTDTPEQAVGTVVDAAASPEGGCDLLAVVQMASAERGPLHLGRRDGPALRLAPLPYTIPAASASS